MSQTPDRGEEETRESHSARQAKDCASILVPVVLLDKAGSGHGKWRGTIPSGVLAGRFDSYRSMLLHLRGCAKPEPRGRAERRIGAGSERKGEGGSGEKTKTISAVPRASRGQLTTPPTGDHYTRIFPFWNQPDLIGLNSYWALDEIPAREPQTTKEAQGDHGTPDRGESGDWKYIQKDLMAFSEVGKADFSWRFGWCSSANRGRSRGIKRRRTGTWTWTYRRRLYEGILRGLGTASPALGGFRLWEWTPGRRRRRRQGLTPGKQAAQEVSASGSPSPWK